MVTYHNNLDGRDLVLKDIKALWYPQITNLQGGPANVVRYLTDKLQKYITICNTYCYFSYRRVFYQHLAESSFLYDKQTFLFNDGTYFSQAHI